MYYPQSTGARIMLIVVYIISIAITIFMGFFFIDFASTWPDWGPGPHPSMFVWIPFAISGFMVLMLVAQVVHMVRKPSGPDSTRGFSVMDDYTRSSSSQSSGYHETTISYRTSPFCRQCGSSLDTELVEWVGPLRFKCPSCGKIGKAEEA